MFLVLWFCAVPHGIGGKHNRLCLAVLMVRPYARRVKRAVSREIQEIQEGFEARKV